MESKCSAFWHHFNIRGDDRIFPCCRFKSPLEQKFDGNVKEVLFYKEYDDLRKQSLEGKYIKGCEKCYYEESMGKESLRQKFNSTYDTDTVGLEFLEIGFDNICNLTCDGCWDEFSSAWSKKNNPNIEHKLHYKSITEIKDVPDSIRKVLFLGGEPLMTNRHEKFLEMIKNPANTEVTYNTNGSFLLSDNLIDKLNNFKKVTFILSIDGYAELNEKVRAGSKWNDVLKFIEQIKNLEYILEINSVLHLNSVHGVKDLEKFVKSLGVKWTMNILTYPKYLNIANYHDKSQLIELVEQTDIPNKEYVINHLK